MIAPIICVLPFIICGVGLTIWGACRLQKARQVKNWPFTSGVIIESSTDERQNQKLQMKYKAKIRYRFEVDGQKREGVGVHYENNRSFYKMIYENNPSSIKFEFDGSESFNNQYAVQALLDKYPVGKQVKIYYNPDNDEETVLETHVPATSYIPVVGGLVFTLFPTVLLLFVLFHK